MKKNIFIIALLLVLCSLFSGCSNYAGEEETGGITINFGTGTARWTGTSPGLTTLKYEIELILLSTGARVDFATINPGSSSHT